MKFYTMDTNFYELLGWQHYIKDCGLAVMKMLWKLEQIYHFRKQRDWETESEEVIVSDAELAELIGTSLNSIKRAINGDKKLGKIGLIEYGLIRPIKDRRFNKKGEATQWIITKPIPFPEEIRTPQAFITLFGIVWCEQQIERLKELHEQKGTQNAYLNSGTQNAYHMGSKMDSIDKQIAHPIYNKNKNLKDGRMDAEGVFSDSVSDNQQNQLPAENQPISKISFETEKELIKLVSVFLKNTNVKQAILPYISNEETALLSIQCLRHSVRAYDKGFVPDNVAGFIRNVLENPDVLKADAEATGYINKADGVIQKNENVSPGGGSAAQMKQKVETSKKRKSVTPTTRDFYKELLASLNEREQLENNEQMQSSEEVVPF
ncbi:hypothetical protein [Brevibacillus brevis]|uniref:hypothetical protein n=1 Tax=Brevibacillus brevis TaxID=1393 RepID=UPI000D0FF9C8|nr:hypothetical protein [Brevibacillus brevis]PSJ67467.1 hypothetical protein C7J99_20970 [Brevibacillus brevis]RED28456.1 hypothetical protein DES34_108323 [Brevibacillus brevis]GEC90710.1 hypothetical protein BBR01nite_30410 [Brevibacillus brevis]VEF91151.1 Uncharacterised protein [Brevibacillus brevis]